MNVPRVAAPGAAEHLSDERVLASIRAGHDELFEILVRRYNRRLFRTARSILRSDAEAEDAVQESYLNAWRHLDGFEGRSSLATWLTRIVVHEALRRSRRRLVLVRDSGGDEGNGEVGEQADDDADGGPEAEAARAEAARLVERTLQSLPESLRSVFVLRCVEDLTTAETAEALELSEGAVRVRLHRARAELRSRLDRHLDDASRSLLPFAGARCDAMTEAVMRRIALERGRGTRAGSGRDRDPPAG